MEGKKPKTIHTTEHSKADFPWISLPPSPLHNVSLQVYLDVELQVLIHGVDVIEDVVCNSGDDSHQLGVVQLPLRTQNQGIFPQRKDRREIYPNFALPEGPALGCNARCN